MLIKIPEGYRELEDEPIQQGDKLDWNMSGDSWTTIDAGSLFIGMTRGTAFQKKYKIGYPDSRPKVIRRTDNA
jgi:hypothetical protein